MYKIRKIKLGFIDRGVPDRLLTLQNKPAHVINKIKRSKGAADFHITFLSIQILFAVHFSIHKHVSLKIISSNGMKSFHSFYHLNYLLFCKWIIFLRWKFVNSHRWRWFLCIIFYLRVFTHYCDRKKFCDWPHGKGGLEKQITICALKPLKARIMSLNHIQWHFPLYTHSVL